ncbi:MAG: uracil-DNA glycosylase [Bryobacteraceae bacterium]
MNDFEPMKDDYPRSMRDAGVRDRRRAMLTLPHVAPLTAYAAKLRLRGSVEVPEFDPLDGGIDARVLFLFEKPGPMTADGSAFSGRSGSGFISRNNDDPSAEATIGFMQKAGIRRKLTVAWNIIPWWNGTRKVTASELEDGVACVRELISMLPKLSAVMMVGQKASRARPYLETTGLALFTSDHPSPLVRAKFPERWNAIPSEWAKAGRFIDDRA